MISFLTGIAAGMVIGAMLADYKRRRHKRKDNDDM